MSMVAILVIWHKPFELTFIPPSHGKSTWNLASIGLAVSKEKKFENVESEWPWTKVNEWSWPLTFTNVHLVVSTSFDVTDYNSLFLYRSIRDQIWPCHKIGQGQSRIIIWINLVVIKYLMLHTKFQGHRPFGSREEDFLKVFTIYGHSSNLGHVTWTIWTVFRSPSHGGSTWNLASIGPMVSEDKMFENVDTHTY